MGKCDPEREIWERLKSPAWRSGGLCGTSICADSSALPAYARAARNLAWEAGRTNYIFRAVPGDSCVSLIYSAELSEIPFEKFVAEMATPVYPKGDCPPKLRWKLSLLSSGIHCVHDVVERLGAPLNAVLACAGEVGKEREAAVKAVGGTYFLVLGPMRRMDSPLFR